MTKEDIQTLIRAGALLAPLAGPYGAVAAVVVEAAISEAAVLFHQGQYSAEELQKIKDDAAIADADWDAAVAKARQDAANRDAQASGGTTDPNA